MEVHERPTPLRLIGCGRLGGLMLTRWLDVGVIAATDVELCVRSAAAAAPWQARGVRVIDEPRLAHGPASIAVLAVKPQQLADAARQWQPALASAVTAVSVLAGIELSALARLAPGPRWQRWMPNTPSRLGLGLIGVTGEADESADAVLVRLRDALGTSVAVSEHEMHAFTAVAGSGPAWAFALVEALAAAAVDAGLAAGQAEDLARRVVIGAGGLLQSDVRPVAALRQEVTSPGGTTAAGLALLQERGWAHHLGEAIAASAARSRALAAKAAAAASGQHADVPQQ